MQGISITALAAVLAVTASGNGAGVDVGAYHGLCQLHLNSGAANAGTNTVKLQHSADNATGWEDVPGAAFAAVGTQASQQTLMLNADGLRRYVRVVDTMAGGANAVSRSVVLVGKKQYA